MGLVNELPHLKQKLLIQNFTQTFGMQGDLPTGDVFSYVTQ